MKSWSKALNKHVNPSIQFPATAHTETVQSAKCGTKRAFCTLHFTFYILHFALEREGKPR